MGKTAYTPFKQIHKDYPHHNTLQFQWFDKDVNNVPPPPILSNLKPISSLADNKE